ncbi:MAG: hypothetical protein ABSF29_08985 [Tepidisphaeraceae bacterium]|jgi:hypothetical protein
MTSKYAYSLSGDQYRGPFSSREEALAQALAAARRSTASPQSIYVGRMVPGDAKTGGHARAVLSNMTARAREEFDDSAGNYLSKLTKPQIEKLDQALELVIRNWLQSENLMPTFFKVEAIGEYPVPASTETYSPSDYREVQEIGSGEYEG